MNTREHMIHMAKAVMLNAYSPYSNFKVGACVRTSNDEYFSGCNIENVSYGLTLCAEASALASLVSSGNKTIVEVAVACSSNTLCSPCGACRQRLAEFAGPDTLVHMANAEGEHQTVRLGDLLPQPFNQQHLGGNL
jgi:cytidine deaminase